MQESLVVREESEPCRSCGRCDDTVGRITVKGAWQFCAFTSDVCVDGQEYEPGKTECFIDPRSKREAEGKFVAGDFQADLPK